MQKTFSKRHCAWLCAILFSLLLSHHAQAEDSDKDAQQARLKGLSTTIEQLKVELKRVKSDRGDLLQDLESSETEIGELEKKVRELREQLEDKQSRLQTLHQERRELTTAKKQQQGSAGKYVNAAYRLGQQSNLKLLLNQQDPSQISRNLRYFNYFLSAQAEKISRYAATIARLNEIEPDIAATVDVIKQDRASLEDKRQQLVASQTERKQTLAKLDANIASKDTELKSLETDRENLELVLQRMAEVSRNFAESGNDQPFAQSKGHLPWPASGRVLHAFGSTRVAGKMNWQGMLITAQEGSPVNAIHQGRIVFSDYLRGHGLLIIVDHGADFMSLYAHNRSLFKDIGDWVNTGEQIAAVGQSGGRNRAGLYFELRYKGEPTNPLTWLKQA